MEFAIYQTSSGNLTNAAVKLLEKIYLSGKRGVFLSPITERVEIINRTLWTFSTNAFIPHGDSKMGFESDQPLYFTDTFKNPNNAKILVLMDTFDLTNENYKKFERIMLIFEDISQIDKINNLYHTLKNNGENVNYWKQSSKGWEKLD